MSIPKMAIEKEVVIEAAVERVWAALAEATVMARWMEDDGVELALHPGGRYRFFGGETTGAVTWVERPVRLEYTWRQAGWAEEWPDSLVQWELAPHERGTLLRLAHSNLPSQEEWESHEEGWDVYWLEVMGRWLEEEGGG